MNHRHDVQNELRALLRGQKMRVTGGRMAVLTALHERQAPMTHEQIMDVIGENDFDRASVWRLLSDLADKGLLRRMDLGDRIWRYELVDVCRDIEASHSHFLCEDCGVVACLPPLEIRTREGLLPESLRHAKFTIRVEGICETCVSPPAV